MHCDMLARAPTISEHPVQGHDENYPIIQKETGISFMNISRGSLFVANKSNLKQNMHYILCMTGVQIKRYTDIYNIASLFFFIMTKRNLHYVFAYSPACSDRKTKKSSWYMHFMKRECITLIYYEQEKIVFLF